MSGRRFSCSPADAKGMIPWGKNVAVDFRCRMHQTTKPMQVHNEGTTGTAFVGILLGVHGRQYESTFPTVYWRLFPWVDRGVNQRGVSGQRPLFQTEGRPQKAGRGMSRHGKRANRPRHDFGGTRREEGGTEGGRTGR